METNIYNFLDPIEYLSSVFMEKKSLNSKFSLRAWSKQLGFSSPNVLSMILRGERGIRPQVANKIGESLRLNKSEKKYFNILSLLHSSKTDEEKNLYINLLKSESPNRDFSALELDHFQVISDWYHFVLYELISLDNFKPDIDWLFKKLNTEVPKKEIQNALMRLERIGLIKFQGNSYRQEPDDLVSTPDDIPSSSLKKLHTQMINKSLVALEEKPVDERHISGSTLAIDKERLPELKKLILKFEHDLANLAQEQSKNSVYQLNVQFFEVINSEEL